MRKILPYKKAKALFSKAERRAHQKRRLAYRIDRVINTPAFKQFLADGGIEADTFQRDWLHYKNFHKLPNVYRRAIIAGEQERAAIRNPSPWNNGPRFGGADDPHTYGTLFVDCDGGEMVFRFRHKGDRAWKCYIAPPGFDFLRRDRLPSVSGYLTNRHYVHRFVEDGDRTPGLEPSGGPVEGAHVNGGQNAPQTVRDPF
jgi:hypothetical protein